ncbi:MAG: SpoIID/LytB domain-containing protein, partial [Planctomycetota bacterium]
MQHEYRLTVYRTMVLWACLIFILFAAGCRKRAEIEPTGGMDSPEQAWIRVLLFGNLRECTVASATGFSVEDTANGHAADFQTDESLGVLALENKLLIGQHKFSGNVLIKPHDPHVFEIDGKAYRGHLLLRLSGDEPTFQAINHVPLESYLLGVVGAEMSSYWEPESLKAQAVAARTYCLSIK